MIGVPGTLFWNIFGRTLLALILSQAFYFVNTSICLLLGKIHCLCLCPA